MHQAYLRTFDYAQQWIPVYATMLQTEKECSGQQETGGWL